MLPQLYQEGIPTANMLLEHHWTYAVEIEQTSVSD
jgi:hypothetical protein